MNWNTLDTLESLEKAAAQGMVLVFKHSTTCPVSAQALRRVEQQWTNEDSQQIKPYLVRVIQERPLSNAIASHYGVRHESPQVLLIASSRCIYRASHEGILYEKIINAKDE